MEEGRERRGMRLQEMLNQVVVGGEEQELQESGEWTELTWKRRG
jgi:hypothetical protein